MHTEDLGRVFSTPALAWQADYENGRRWLSLDLLCGRVDARHPWRARLEEAGVCLRALDGLLEGDAAPDLIGVNHYVTSDRFLNHRLDRYAPVLHGGNGPEAYVDIEAVRAGVPSGSTGWIARLMERLLILVRARIDYPPICEHGRPRRERVGRWGAD